MAQGHGQVHVVAVARRGQGDLEQRRPRRGVDHVREAGAVRADDDTRAAEERNGLLLVVGVPAEDFELHSGNAAQPRLFLNVLIIPVVAGLDEGLDGVALVDDDPAALPAQVVRVAADEDRYYSTIARKSA